MNKQKWNFRTGGIPDELFARGQVPMTKSEVRAVTIAKARLLEGHIIWDIGAGTGSISVEAALIATKGEVHAVEKETDAVDLIKQNALLFGAVNVKVHVDTAPRALHGLPCPDRVFIGGSGGNLKEIIEYVYEQLPVGGRLVINAVVLETLTTAIEVMNRLAFADLDIAELLVSKIIDVGSMHMFKSHNPVFIISGEKK